LDIRILHNSKIDKAKWDACIDADHTALIYSRSWLLDIMADDWYGLVAGDYTAVLPLPVKTKFGLRFIAMPPFVQQLNIAGKYDNTLINALQKEVLQFSSLIQFSTAYKGLLLPETEAVKRTNYILPLDRPYGAILDKYTSPCRKNLAKAARRGCRLCEDISTNDVVTFYSNAYSSRSSYTGKHIGAIKQLLDYAKAHGQCTVTGVRDGEGMMVYAGALLDDGRRLYYILGAPDEKGREMRATYFFIDRMIQRFAGQRALFNFEGSDIPSVAQFYQSFSPDIEYYYRFYINRYPFPLKKLIDKRLGY
jgi:hypothetical protein